MGVLMDDRYGPDDASVPTWTSPSAVPDDLKPGRTVPLGSGHATADAPGPVAGVSAPSDSATANPWKPGIILLRPLKVGDVLDGAIKAVRHNPRVTIGVTAIIMLIAQVAVSAAGWGIFGEPGLFDPAATDIPALDDSQIVGTLAGFLVAIPIYLLLALAAGALTTISTSRAILGTKLSTADAWTITKRRLPALARYSVVVFIAVLSIVLLGNALASVSPGLVALYWLGILVAVLIVAVRLLLVPVIITLEGLGVMAGIARAWVLIRGRAWPVFGISLLAGLIMWVVRNIFSLPMAIVATTAMFSNPQNAGLALNLASGLSMYLGGLISVSFGAAIATLLYTDLRIRKEGFDLQLLEASRAAQA